MAEAVREIIGQPENVENLLRVLREERSAVQAEAVAQLERLAARRADISRQLDAATNAVLAGLVSDTLMVKVHALEAERMQIDRDMQLLRQQMSGSELPDEKIRELFSLAQNDIPSLLSLVVRVEVGREEIVIWTLLDATASGEFDFSADGVAIYNNSWCRWRNTKDYYKSEVAENQIFLVGSLLKIILPRKKREP